MSIKLQKSNFQKFIVSKQVLDAETADRVFNELVLDGKNIVDLILAKGLLNEDVLRDLLAEYTGWKVGEVPFGLPYRTYEFIKYNISQKYRIVCFEVSDSFVRVATDNPLNLEMKEIIDFLSRARGIQIGLFVVSRSDMNQLLAAYREVYERRKDIYDNVPNNINNESEEQPLAHVQMQIDKVEKVEAPKPVQKEKEMSAAASTENLESNAVVEERIEELREGGLFEDDYNSEQKSWLKLLQKNVESREDLQGIINTRNIPQIVASFVNFAIHRKASDVHIEPMPNKIRVRYRIDGVLEEVVQMDKTLQPALISRIKILALLKIDEHRVPQDGQFRVTFEGRLVDLRISSLPTVYGEKIVIRILDVSGGRLTLEQLGLQGLNKEKVERNSHRNNGMILATGPTGSGKSTTLFSILGIVSVPGVNVITLEDPVEYHIPGVNQCQINDEIGFSFAKGLRSILRQDPNVIMVGEIRDTETAELAVHASLTGHLVLSTLHTNDAPSAVPRLIDMEVEPFLIASSLVLVMAQRLVRKVCDHCKSEITVPESKKVEITESLKTVPSEHLKRINLDLNDMKFYRGLGCDYCNNTGFKGRIAVYEIMEMSDELQKLAIKKVSGNDIFEQAVREGMITMRQDGFIKALQGMTTLDEVYRVTTK
ncbi:MAG TPA: type II/IV secretion system protein [bacterium]|nr:type II/IV secretion system protein [bacterium]